MLTEELRSEVEIAASPGKVWAVLTDFEAYPSWNPFIVSLEGQPVAGARLRVEMRPPGGRGMTFRPTVTSAERPRVFCWLGRLVVKGLFDGAHRFELEPLPDGRTRMVQSERFGGLLVPFLRTSLRAHTLAGFEAMNRALAERVEAAG